MKNKFLPLLLSLAFTFPLFAADVPSDEDLSDLVLESLTAINDGVVDNNFTDCLATMSTPAREQLTPEKLQAGFQDFIAKKINISGIKDLEPTFDGKKIDAQGVLRVSGTYPTTPVKVHFALGYVQEDEEWKLLGIKVDTNEDNPTDAQKKN